MRSAMCPYRIHSKGIKPNMASSVIGMCVCVKKIVVASKGIGIEINVDESMYMTMFRDQNAGRSHCMKIDNSSFERLEEFKYLGTTLTNQNSIQEEIKRKLKSGNAC